MTIDKVIDNVLVLFMKYGLKSVSMDDISRKLGISKKTLYQVVENKTDLVERVFQRYIQMEQEAINEIVRNSTNAVEAIVGISKYITALLREVSPTTIYDMQKYYGEIFRKIEKIQGAYIYDIMRANIERGISEGLYRENLDPDIIAKLYINKNSFLVNEDIFPLKKYNTEILYLEHIRYHIHGVASAKGIKLFEKYTTAND